MNNSLLKKKYINQYKFREFGETGILLECQGRPLFVIGSGADLRDDFIIRLFDSLNQDKCAIPKYIS